MRRKPDSVSASIGQRIRWARDAVGVTQEELASALGMRRPSLSDIENGKQEIVASRLYEIALLLDCAPSYFFEGLWK